MLQRNQVNLNKIINVKRLSIINRYLAFIYCYMSSFDHNLNIDEHMDFIIDEDLDEHIDHILETWPLIKEYTQEFKLVEPDLDKIINESLNNNRLDNLGIVGLILKLILFDLHNDPENANLYITDYFTISNIFNIPESYIKMMNKIIKNIKIDYNH